MLAKLYHCQNHTANSFLNFAKCSSDPIFHESDLEHYYRFAMLNICLRKLEWPQSQLTMQRLQLSTVFLLDPGTQIGVEN